LSNKSTNSKRRISTVLLECPDHPPGEDFWRSAIYVTLFLIGAVFLLATIVVHLVLPTLTRGVRGKGLVAHCSFMFVAHIALIVVYLKGTTLDNGPCHILGEFCPFLNYYLKRKFKPQLRLF